MTKHLPKGVFKRGKGFAVRVAVPTHLQDKLGKREIVRGLGTQDKREAISKAAQVFAEIQSDIESGKLLKKTKKKTIKDVGYEWLSRANGINHSTKRKYLEHLEAFMEFTGDIPCDTLDRELALRYYDHLSQKVSQRTGERLSVRSIKSHTNFLASFYRVIDHFGLVDPDKRNPFSSLDRRLPGQAKTIDKRAKVLRPITRDEAQAWCDLCEGNLYQDEMRLCLRVLWSTGCRLSEIADRQSKDIVDHGDFIEIIIDEGKTDAAKRSLFLVDKGDLEAMRETLSGAQGHDRLLHRVSLGGYNRRPSHTLSKGLQKQRKKIDGHQHFDAHSFRRNVVSTLVNLDVPVHVRNLMVGHS